ncbi:MAG TPA: arsinothricin resistance N-acetyltransferase ArsN1 family B [Candidatus Dormibacteraeota bacterium]|nr:arsinothricin resistance N-acetyltransferase ArsN1 family B [Candidatus Dormibacteraeota bacterium]
MYDMRLAQAADAAQIAAIYAPIVERTAISMEERAPSADEVAARIAATVPTWPWLVADDGGGILGYVYAGRHRERAGYRWAVDTAVYVAERGRRRGVGRALYGALFRLLALQGYHRAYAGIALPNEGSLALHRAVGFEPVGVYRRVGFKLGAWHDVSWWARSLREDPAPAGEPVPSTALQEPAIRAALAGWERRPQSDGGGAAARSSR